MITEKAQSPFSRTDLDITMLVMHRNIAKNVSSKSEIERLDPETNNVHSQTKLIVAVRLQKVDKTTQFERKMKKEHLNSLVRMTCAQSQSSHAVDILHVLNFLCKIVWSG